MLKLETDKHFNYQSLRKATERSKFWGLPKCRECGHKYYASNPRKNMCKKCLENEKSRYDPHRQQVA